MHDFSFNGVSLSSLGGRIMEAPMHTIATRDKSFSKIYGQSGDELIDNGSYNNVPFSIKIGFFTFVSRQTAEQLARAIINWLAPLQDGYYVYRDSYNEGYFTQAALVNFDQIQREMRTFLTATLNFSRVPFWYSDVGAQTVVQNESGYVNLHNPENIPSEPVATLEYTGTASNLVNYSLYMGTYISFKASTVRNYQVFDGVQKQHYQLDNGQKIYISSSLPPNLRPNAYYACYAKFLATETIGRDIILSITPNWRRL